ncbi:uncharacterized protein [Asterias amurensis]|uniref:uncharacterized protein isoform X1 n=1 Tax=Asterias amurensis TaxID=7602 RepID=UPI003AB38158
MASASQTMDSLLATLVGMGFTLERCQAAVSFGKLTVHDAVEWLLQDEIPMHSAPTLSLNIQGQETRPGTDAGNHPITLPPVSSLSSSPKETTEQHSSLTEDKSKFLQKDVVSRFSLSEQKKQEKEKWETEQREKAAAQARQARLQEKKARSYLLKNIEADKEARQGLSKVTTSPKSTHQQQEALGVEDQCFKPTLASVPHHEADQKKSGGGSPTLVRDTPTSIGGSATHEEPATCVLQIRLPSGQTIREKFLSSATLQSVDDCIRTKQADLTSINFIQPFPHRLFTTQDGNSTLEELKLTPTGCLVVKIAPPQSSSDDREVNDGMAQSAPPDQSSPPKLLDGQLPSSLVNAILPPHLLPQPPVPLHQWGSGQALSPENDLSGEEHAPMDVEDVIVQDEEMGDVDEEGEREEDMLWGAPAPPQHVPWGLQDVQGGGNYDWGGGNRLQDGRRNLNFDYGFRNVEPGANDPEGVPSPQRAAAAALSRLAAAAVSQASSCTSKSPERPASSLPALQDLCLHCVSKRIEGRSHQPVTTLEALPPHIASQLVDELKKSATLRPKTLNLFLPCHLQHLTLDCYKYTTNELMQAVRLHIHINRLSLCACPLLTDQAFVSISSMKKLQHLNISNNKQLTDGSLQSIKDLSNLVTLIMEDTSVSDKGVSDLASSSMVHLTHLSLSRTNVSDTVIPLLAVFPNLKSLSLEKTKVSSLQGIGNLTTLGSINIARNTLTAEALDQLANLPDLQAVNVMLLEGLTGDKVLHHLQGLDLKQLQMPDRHTTTNNGLCSIAGMPLVALDLTDYIHITDDGIHHIADMTSLTKLSLNNTKITDLAMTYIKGLVELKELHLDRTAITDEGASVIGCFNRLQVLSMAATQIRNKFLCSKALNSCSQMTRLNLSRTNVSNQGIQSLQLPHLSLLNLDSTCVTMDGANQLHGCPNLRVVRTNNLRVYRGDEDDN